MRLISVAHEEGTLNDLRAILRNDVPLHIDDVSRDEPFIEQVNRESETI